jgi:hypothetical protein
VLFDDKIRVVFSAHSIDGGVKASIGVAIHVKSRYQGSLIRKPHRQQTAALIMAS